LTKRAKRIKYFYSIWFRIEGVFLAKGEEFKTLAAGMLIKQMY
jgi:hypothetical protein